MADENKELEQFLQDLLDEEQKRHEEFLKGHWELMQMIEEARKEIDNRGYGGKKERERKEPNETSCPQYSSPSYPQSQQLTANDIVDLFNDICTTYPTVDGITQYSTALSNSLMFDRYSKADYSTIFQKAEQSSNLKARTHDEESPVDFGWILEHSKEIKDGAFDN